MATVTTVGTASSTTSGPALTRASITASVGDWLVAGVAADNAGTSGASSTSSTITDGSGNTPVHRSETNNTPGNASSDGTTLNLWAWPIVDAMSAESIDFNFVPDTTAKVAAMWKVTPDAGKTIVFHSVGAGAEDTGTAMAAPTASVPLGGIVFGIICQENQNNQSGSDSDTTNGSWSATQSGTANVGSSATSQAMVGQYKIVTAAGDQTYDFTVGNSREWAANNLVLLEVVSGTLAATDAADAAALAGTVSTSGTLAATDSADAAAFTTGLSTSGTLAATDAADTARFIAPTSAPRAGTKSARILVRIDWPDEEVTRLWVGNGAFVDGDGAVWRGSGQVTGLDELERAMNGEAPGLTATLSGVSPETSGRIWTYRQAGNLTDAMFTVLLQKCDDYDQPQGPPRVRFTGYFVNSVFTDEGGDQPVSAVSAEIGNKFGLRRTPNHAVLSDADQKARSAVLNPMASPDRFAERMSLLESKTVTWPRFS